MQARNTIAPFLALSLAASACESNHPTSPNFVSDGPQTSASPNKREFNGFPFYARSDGLPILDGYAVIYFYVQDPGVIPVDFNLLLFFDPVGAGQLPLDAWAVDGFSFFADAGDAIPKKVHSEGKGAVPFWFLPAAVAEGAVADGVLTVPELESLDPIKGFATHFVEDLHPVAPPGLPGGHPQPGLKVEAQGELSGGGSFHVNGSTHFVKGERKLRGNIILRK